MDALDVTHFSRCLGTLDRAMELYQQAVPDSVDADLFRSACVKEFELLVEVAGKLLKKRLRPYFASNQDTDRLTYKNVFRHAARCGLLPLDVVERWLGYRDIRNKTAHEYGTDYADSAMAALPDFAADAHVVEQSLLN